MKKKQNYSLKKGIVIGVVAGIATAASVTSFSNLIKDGKFELFKSPDSKIQTHSLETIVNKDGVENQYNYFVSDYNLKEQQRNVSTITFSEPCDFTNNKIKIKNSVYTINEISPKTMKFLIKSLDLSNQEDKQVLENLLLENNSKLSDASYSFITLEEYQREYSDNNKNYSVTYYSYNNNYDQTSIKDISSDELIEYYRQLILNTTFGVFIGGGVFAIPAYILNERKNRQKAKIK